MNYFIYWNAVHVQSVIWFTAKWTQWIDMNRKMSWEIGGREWMNISKLRSFHMSRSAHVVTVIFILFVFVLIFFNVNIYVCIKKKMQIFYGNKTVHEYGGNAQFSGLIERKSVSVWSFSMCGAMKNAIHFACLYGSQRENENEKPKKRQGKTTRSGERQSSICSYWPNDINCNNFQIFNTFKCLNK